MITEIIQANQFNSGNEGMYLVERDAPSPKEKEIIEDVPHSQGVLDFSMIFGERKFKNRVHTYEFIRPDTIYAKSKVVEQDLKRKLMMNSTGPIFDTHDHGYYWLGKCIDVDVEDDREYNRMLITIKFDVYPFMLTIKSWFDDVWDTFNFDRDVANFTKYEVKGEREIVLFNSGDITVTPVVVTQGGVFQLPERPPI